MQVEELRIGNWLKWKDNQTEFDITNGMMLMENFWTHVKEGDIIPIAITDEILISCGFEENGYGGYSISPLVQFDIHFVTELNCFSVDINSEYPGNSDREILSVHQLQNLYFALTGTELLYSSPTIKSIYDSTRQNNEPL